MKQELYKTVSAVQGLAFNSLKQLISWNDGFKVHEPDIDDQHKAIFNLAVETSELCREAKDTAGIRALLDQFGELLQKHFSFEEQKLAEIGYPKLEQHRAEHEAMLQEHRFIRRRLDNLDEEAAFPEVKLVVLNFMIGVTVGHILHSDADYANFALQLAGDSDGVWPGA